MSHPHPPSREESSRKRVLPQLSRGYRSAILLGVLLIFPFIAPQFLVYVALHIAIFVIGCHGLSLLTGFTGQISLGHAAFMGIGAYSSAILMVRLGMPFWLTVPAGALVAAIVGLALGVPSLRLKGLYLAFATLAAQYVIEFLIRRWDTLTGGVQGFLVPPATLLGWTIEGDRSYYFLVVFLAILSTWTVRNLMISRIGRAFQAIRDSEIAAAAVGINVFAYKLLAFSMAAFYAGIAGALWGHYLGVITHDQFGIALSVEYLAFVIIGGIGHVSAAIIGPAFLICLTEALTYLTSTIASHNPGALTVLVSAKEILFGVVIIVFLVFLPAGLAPRFQSRWVKQR